MNIHRLDIVHWEPCTLHFQFTPKPKLEDFENAIKHWPINRSRFCPCNCYQKSLTCSPSPDETTIAVNLQWVCDTCLPNLVALLENSFSGLRRVELGAVALHLKDKDDEFARIGAKKVKFEDGAVLDVKSFTIGRSAVSALEYETFAKETGYVTFAESVGSRDIYNSHSGLSGPAGSSRLSNVAAQFVTLRDAEAFCSHRSYRLPTEEEWMAASILDFQELDLTPMEVLRRQFRTANESALRGDFWDITASRSKGDLVVARRGPRDFITKGWKEEQTFAFNRRLLEPDAFGMSITFRVVLLE